MSAEPLRAIREETVENCLQELQRRSNFHNVPELTYALTYARSCLKAILENAMHSELAELFKAAYGKDIRDFVPQCVDEEVKAFLKEAGCIGIDEKDVQLREYYEYFCILGLVLRVHGIFRGSLSPKSTTPKIGEKAKPQQPA
jgi:hypothetical protein